MARTLSNKKAPVRRSRVKILKSGLSKRPKFILASVLRPAANARVSRLAVFPKPQMPQLGPPILSFPAFLERTLARPNFTPHPRRRLAVIYSSGGAFGDLHLHAVAWAALSHISVRLIKRLFCCGTCGRRKMGVLRRPRPPHSTHSYLAASSRR